MLSLYGAGQVLGSDRGLATQSAPAVEVTVPTGQTKRQARATSSQRVATICPHTQKPGYRAGCKLSFRGEACCKAVETLHECHPPKDIRETFTRAGGPISPAQIRIANGSHL